MKFGLTIQMVEDVYVYLMHSLPFRRMKLPEPDALAFRLTEHCDRYAHFKAKEAQVRRFHEIGISARMVTDSLLLMPAMAHEMIHLYQEESGTAPTRVQHNAEFWRIAKIACRIHNFELKTF